MLEKTRNLLKLVLEKKTSQGLLTDQLRVFRKQESSETEPLSLSISVSASLFSFPSLYARLPLVIHGFHSITDSASIQHHRTTPMHALVLSGSICPTLCDPVDWSPEWLPCPPPADLPDPGIKPASLTSPALAGGFFTTSATWEAMTTPTF